MNYFSLFSGIGGFELGIDKAIQRTTKQSHSRMGISSTRNSSLCSVQPLENYTCVGFSEIDKYAIQIYKKHFPNHKEYGDVTNITWSNVPDFELLCGGFPCQSFSIAGKRGGFLDTRGTLFFEIARAAQEKQPRFLLLENVKGLLSHDKGKTFGIILNALDELGYDLQWQVLNSKNFGVPQNRERVFIIGHLRGTSRPQIFPIGQNDECIKKSGGFKSGLWSQSLDSNYYKGADGKRTMISNGVKVRRLTPTECERLQGFPDGWTAGVSDTQRYKCLGNAVTTNVISTIMEKILDSPPQI